MLWVQSTVSKIAWTTLDYILYSRAVSETKTTHINIVCAHIWYICTDSHINPRTQLQKSISRPSFLISAVIWQMRRWGSRNTKWGIKITENISTYSSKQERYLSETWTGQWVIKLSVNRMWFPTGRLVKCDYHLLFASVCFCFTSRDDKLTSQCGTVFWNITDKCSFIQHSVCVCIFFTGWGGDRPERHWKVLAFKADKTWASFLNLSKVSSHNNECIPIMKSIILNKLLITFPQIAGNPTSTPLLMRHKQRGAVMPDRRHLIPIHY